VPSSTSGAARPNRSALRRLTTCAGIALVIGAVALAGAGPALAVELSEGDILVVAGETKRAEAFGEME